MPADRASIIDLLSRIHLFRDVETQKIEAFADKLVVLEYPPAGVIFDQGDDPDYFYFVFDGRVRLSRNDSQTNLNKPLGFLDKFDYFGQEVLENTWARQVSATADNDVTLLRISVPDFSNSILEIPTLSERLQFILDSYRLMLKTRFIWQDPEEMVYFVSRRHAFFLVTNILAPLLWSIISIPPLLFWAIAQGFSLLPLALLFLDTIVSLAWLVWSYVDWTNDYYVVTNRRVLFIEKVVLLYDSRQESPLTAIQSTFTTTTQIGRILNYGNVAIRTLIGTILFRDVPSPSLVLALIQEQQMRAQILESSSALKDIRARIDDRITKGPQLPPPPRTPKPQERPSVMRQFISTMFHLRYEQGGTVIYRTHIFILLKHIWLPSLMLIGLAGLFLSSALNQFALLSLAATCSLSFLVGFVISVWWFYQYMDWHNDIYLITPEQVVDVNRKPLGSESRQAAPLKNILSIEYKRIGIIGLLLDYGTVYIRVGDQMLTFDEVYKPSEVQRELFDRLQRTNAAERKAALEAENRRNADWIAIYNEWVAKNPPQQPPAAQRGGF